MLRHGVGFLPDRPLVLCRNNLESNPRIIEQSSSRRSDVFLAEADHPFHSFGMLAVIRRFSPWSMNSWVDRSN